MKIIFFILLLTIPAISLALANPAAVNCADKGYKYLLVNSVGICVFPDNSYCEEWAYFKGSCQPGQNTAPPQNDNPKLQNNFN